MLWLCWAAAALILAPAPHTAPRPSPSSTPPPVSVWFLWRAAESPQPQHHRSNNTSQQPTPTRRSAHLPYSCSVQCQQMVFGYSYMFNVQFKILQPKKACFGHALFDFELYALCSIGQNLFLQSIDKILELLFTPGEILKSLKSLNVWKMKRRQTFL